MRPLCLIFASLQKVKRPPFAFRHSQLLPFFCGLVDFFKVQKNGRCFVFFRACGGCKIIAVMVFVTKNTRQQCWRPSSLTAALLAVSQPCAVGADAHKNENKSPALHLWPNSSLRSAIVLLFKVGFVVLVDFFDKT